MNQPSAAVSPPARVSLGHLRSMMGPAGIVQFSHGRTPDSSSGTCLDDNARVWIVAMAALSSEPRRVTAREIGDTAAEFLVRAQLPDGRFHNLADVRGRYTDDVGSEDSIGRAIWACGTAACCAPLPLWRAAAIGVLDAALPAIERLSANHARAYSVLGLAAALDPEAASLLPIAGDSLAAPMRDRVASVLKTVADGLLRDFHSFATDDWSWWTDTLTWGNGRLPEAMLRAASATGERRYAQTGIRALEFLGEITQPEGVFVPIGNDGWYRCGGRRAKYDQQPIESCAMVEAWLAAARLTGDASYLQRARTAYAWFDGLNTERIAVGVPETGACYDGLMRGCVNRNQGAESTLSYLQARLAIDAAPAR